MDIHAAAGCLHNSGNHSSASSHASFASILTSHPSERPSARRCCILQTPYEFLRRWEVSAFVGLVALFLVLLANAALPGMVGEPANAFAVEGQMRCLSQSWQYLVSLSCESLGFPHGYAILTGGPHVALGAVLMWLPGVGSGGAYIFSSAVFLGFAFIGGYGLMKRLGAGWMVAVGASVTYLISPTIFGMQGFGGTFFGFALLPAYALADLLMIEVLEKRRWTTVAAAFIPFAGMKTLALFMDGYSFVAAGLVGAALWLEWAVRKGTVTRGRRFAGPGLLLGANLCAAGAYTAFESTDYGKPALAIFRGLGLDLVTLVSPSEFLWFAREAGWAVNRSDLWGDGSNVHYNYIGFICLALAVAALVRRPFPRRHGALALAGVAALVLSFGPALKFDVERPSADGVPSHSAYAMPEGEALELPWSEVFVSLAGLDSMRATYRWFGVTRMVLILLAGLGVTALLKKGGATRVAAIVLAIAAVVELSPDFLGRAAAYRDRRTQMDEVTEQVEKDLVAASDAGDRVFFLNYDGSRNYWLSNYLAPAASLTAYNAAGDKNHALAAQEWPEEVAALAPADVSADDLNRALGSGHVDAVIVPFFHLRHDAYSWPPPEEKRVLVQEGFSDLLNDPRFAVDRRRWLAVVTPDPYPG